MKYMDIKERVRQNQELLRNNPIEYVSRLRVKADEFVGEVREYFLNEADKIEREHC